MSIRLREMFRSYRESNNLSYRELGLVTGIEFNALHRFESGKPVDEETFTAIVKWLMGEHNPDADKANAKALRQAAKAT
jgi:transcriptional regulator with XRE-family HTH domain